MAKRFVLTTELRVAGPLGLAEVTNKIRQAVKNIKGSIEIDFSKRANQNLNEMNRRLKILSDRLDLIPAKATTAAQAMERLGAAFGAASAPMAGVLKSFHKVQTASKQTTRHIQETGDQLTIFANQAAVATRRFLAFAIPASILFKLGFAIRNATAEALEFQNTMVRISQVSGRTVSQLGSLEQEISGISKEFGVSSKSLLEVSQTLFQAGLSANQVSRALKQLALTEVAPTFTDVGKTTEGLIAIMGQFSLSVDDAASKLATINTLAARYAVESDDIITATRKAGGVFADAGGSFEEFAALLTAVRSKTRESADTIGTAFKTIFQRLQRPKTIEKLEELTNIKIVEEGKLKNPIRLFKELNQAIQDLEPGDIKRGQIIEEIGGLRQAGKSLPLLKEIKTAIQALDDAVLGQASLLKDAEVAQASLLRQATKVKEEFLELFRAVVNDDAFQAMARGVLNLASALITLADSLRPVIPLLTLLTATKAVTGAVRFGKAFIPKFKNAGLGHSDQFTSGSIAPLLGRSKGGKIPGTGNTDNILAALTPGEFIINRDSARAIGLDRLQALNQMGRRGIPGFTHGGGVGDDGDSILNFSRPVHRPISDPKIRTNIYKFKDVAQEAKELSNNLKMVNVRAAKTAKAMKDIYELEPIPADPKRVEAAETRAERSQRVLARKRGQGIPTLASTIPLREEAKERKLLAKQLRDEHRSLQNQRRRPGYRVRARGDVAARTLPLFGPGDVDAETVPRTFQVNRVPLSRNTNFQKVGKNRLVIGGAKQSRLVARLQKEAQSIRKEREIFRTLSGPSPPDRPVPPGGPVGFVDRADLAAQAALFRVTERGRQFRESKEQILKDRGLLPEPKKSVLSRVLTSIGLKKEQKPFLPPREVPITNQAALPGFGFGVGEEGKVTQTRTRRTVGRGTQRGILARLANFGLDREIFSPNKQNDAVAARINAIANRQIEIQRKSITAEGVSPTTKLGGRLSLLKRLQERGGLGDDPKAAGFQRFPKFFKTAAPEFLRRSQIGQRAIGTGAAVLRRGQEFFRPTKGRVALAGAALGAAAFNRFAPENETTEGISRVATGAGVGALTGFQFGGPIGAFAGGLAGATIALTNFQKELSQNKVQKALDQAADSISNFERAASEQDLDPKSLIAEFSPALAKARISRQTFDEENKLQDKLGTFGGSFSRFTDFLFTGRDPELGIQEETLKFKQSRLQNAIQVGTPLRQSGITLLNQIAAKEKLSKKDLGNRLLADPRLGDAGRAIIAAKVNEIDSGILTFESRINKLTEDNRFGGNDAEIARARAEIENLKKIRNRFGQNHADIGEVLEIDNVDLRAGLSEVLELIDDDIAKFVGTIESLNKVFVESNLALVPFLQSATNAARAAAEYKFFAAEMDRSNALLLSSLNRGPASLSFSEVSASLSAPANSARREAALLSLDEFSGGAGSRLASIDRVKQPLEGFLADALASAGDQKLKTEEERFAAFQGRFNEAVLGSNLSDVEKQTLTDQVKLLEPDPGKNNFDEFLQGPFADQLKQIFPDISNAKELEDALSSLATAVDERGNKFLDGLGKYQEMVSQLTDLELKRIDVAKEGAFTTIEQTAQFQGRTVLPQELKDLGNEVFNAQQDAILQRSRDKGLFKTPNEDARSLAIEQQFFEASARDALLRAKEIQNDPSLTQEERSQNVEASLEEAREFERASQDAARALDNLANRTDNTSAALAKLDLIQGDIGARRGSAIDFLTSDLAGRRQIIKDRNLAERVFRQGNFNGLNVDQQARAARFLQQNQDVVVNGRPLRDFLNELVQQDPRLQPFGIGQEQQNQFDAAIKEYRDAIEANIAAQQEQATHLEEKNDRFLRNIQTEFEAFDKAVRAIPHKIDLEGNHQVNVNINGAEVLGNLQPEIQGLIKSSMRQILEKNLKAHFPGLPVKVVT